MKIHYKISILEELNKNGRLQQIVHENLPYIDLFSCLYDQKWPNTLSVHVGKRSRMSVHNCINNMHSRILTS